MSAWSYDLIAEVYDTDMGSNLAVDDVGYYADLCRAAPGPVLELGCGTGRVTLPLLAAGIDVTGVDRSWPMLRRLARDAVARGLAARCACMDAAALSFTQSFQTVIAPFSMVTYLTDDTALDAMLAGVRALLRPGGRLALDAFAPRDVSAFAEFRQDYDRSHGEGRLARFRRIAPLDGGRNRIERLYRLTAPGQAPREWTTIDTIRPYTENMLIEAGERAGFALDRVDHDYGRRTSDDPDFATVVLTSR
ncbi:class I SAM-dependent methyltransferase [Caulobacter sp. CCNWLY153]|uniref:Methyltransferase domain-containing protein n=1 Tax=Caulobacter radicis TaxID=2172650 RepID=A0A2T9IXG0_9CAUL|nr:class I SAM-dependent methyltransferase [Caulobacter radicis]PVM71700.1 hypothetical protein DDF65_23660 [Caulobacter radicis]